MEHKYIKFCDARCAKLFPLWILKRCRSHHIFNIFIELGKGKEISFGWNCAVFGKLSNIPKYRCYWRWDAKLTKGEIEKQNRKNAKIGNGDRKQKKSEKKNEAYRCVQFYDWTYYFQFSIFSEILFWYKFLPRARHRASDFN